MTTASHRRAERFEFHEDRECAVIVCTRVHQGAPVLHVSHDVDGDWQFLCGGQHAADGPDRAVVACLECVVSDDPSLNDVADLCGNWSADRDAPGGRWTRHDRFEDDIREAVDKHGWFVAMVEGGGSDDAPAFAYTIGLYETFGHAELICLGQPTRVMHAMLNNCGHLIRSGHPPPIGAPFGEVLDDYDVLLREVRAPTSYHDYLGYAIWYYRGRTFPVLQLVWPDKAGRFPGEPGAEIDMTQVQPLLA